MCGLGVKVLYMGQFVLCRAFYCSIYNIYNANYEKKPIYLNYIYIYILACKLRYELMIEIIEEVIINAINIKNSN